MTKHVLQLEIKDAEFDNPEQISLMLRLLAGRIESGARPDVKLPVRTFNGRRLGFFSISRRESAREDYRQALDAAVEAAEEAFSKTMAAFKRHHAKA